MLQLWRDSARRRSPPFPEVAALRQLLRPMNSVCGAPRIADRAGACSARRIPTDARAVFRASAGYFANSRPYEGFLFCIPAALLVCLVAYRKKRNHRSR